MKKRGGDTKRPEAAAAEEVSRVSGFPIAVTPVITLLTDFGTSDYFVGAMKGVILNINSHVKVVDITHNIPPHDIETGAFTLLAVYESFSPGTIHVAVVDPDVGSSRRPILLEAGNQIFIGPDNGLFSYIYDREAIHQVFHLTNEQYFRHPVSATFHGRDIFSPVAATISLKTGPVLMGPRIEDYVRLESLVPVRLADGKLRGRIIHIDHFGNCITNFAEQDLETRGSVSLNINGKRIKSFKRFFADETGEQDELFGIFGSAGFLEISAKKKSAAQVLKAERGQRVVVSYETTA